MPLRRQQPHYIELQHQINLIKQQRLLHGAEAKSHAHKSAGVQTAYPQGNKYSSQQTLAAMPA